MNLLYQIGNELITFKKSSYRPSVKEMELVPLRLRELNILIADRFENSIPQIYAVDSIEVECIKLLDEINVEDMKIRPKDRLYLTENLRAELFKRYYNGLTEIKKTLWRIKEGICNERIEVLLK